ncbi:hypothetical protein RvY_05592 [Ramazzottius varieornatus]|uniref:SAGA-associated factor 11 n=1 Tax=Ramazzottius varieornatus TaxID=947166 RepID=A0A1D1UVK0_RAMVA|nr:hypothetical protein RvY_05592 [Ramazzottius varieornatus]
MPTHPNLLAADPSTNLRDHGMLFHKERMDTLSRPLLLSSSNVSYLPIAVRDTESMSDLYQYAPASAKRHEPVVNFARPSPHDHPFENGQDKEAESSSEETGLLQEERPSTAEIGLVPLSKEELARSSSDLPSSSYMSPSSPESVQEDSVEPVDEYSPLHDHNYCRFPQPCDSTLAQIPPTNSPPCELSSNAEADVVEPESNSSVGEVPSLLPPSQSSAYSEDVRPDMEEPTPSLPSVRSTVDLDSKTLTALLKELTEDELDIFDNLMDSIVDTQTTEVVSDSMTDGHLPVEPTHAEIDAMTGTWEDLFQNPYEYMLHTPDKCPNCGRFIALSRMAPHMISACGEKKRLAADRKKRTSGRKGRQTRSQVSVAEASNPSTSSNLVAEDQSSQGPLLEPVNLLEGSRPPPVADPKRMAGLEDTILRLKKRVKIEEGEEGSAEPSAKRALANPSEVICLD